MRREDLSDDKKEKYDLITKKIMEEIEEQTPDQYYIKGRLDGEGTKIYQRTFNKYRPELSKLFEE